MKKIAVLTGDLVNSRQVDAAQWLPVLKKLLNHNGPGTWEIFRGDSFQIVVSPLKAFEFALFLKAGIKQVKGLDVRIAIGVGAESFSSSKITESNGTAYVRSGECFENLKKQHLGFKTGTQLDEALNVMCALALLSINSWTTTVASVIRTSLENPQKSQGEIAELLKRSQSSISEALSRGGFEEVMQMNHFYQKQLSNL